MDEQINFDAWDRMRALEQQAERTAKTMRRDQQPRRLHASREDPLPATPAPQDASRPFGRLEPADHIRPFTEIEVLE